MERKGINLGEIDVNCYAISAPFVCLGRESHRVLSQKCDASGIRHYFCRYDAVHGGPLAYIGNVGSAVFGAPIRTMNRKWGSRAIIAWHLGCEIPLLGVDDGFPDAHEPEAVYRGLHPEVDRDEDDHKLFFMKFDIVEVLKNFLNPTEDNPWDEVTNEHVYNCALGVVKKNSMVDGDSAIIFNRLAHITGRERGDTAIVQGINRYANYIDFLGKHVNDIGREELSWDIIAGQVIKYWDRKLIPKNQNRRYARVRTGLYILHMDVMLRLLCVKLWAVTDVIDDLELVLITVPQMGENLL